MENNEDLNNIGAAPMRSAEVLTSRSASVVLDRHRKREKIKKLLRACWAYLTDTWLLELLATGLSIVSSIAVCVLLAVWNGKPPPKAGGITFNAIVSILATASKSAMSFVVSSCIAQSKGTWFSESQPLSHIQFFDDASRGPLGAVTFLSRPTMLSVASVGAWITLLALAFDPFVQQALDFPSKPFSTESGSVWVPQASIIYNPGTDLLRESVLKRSLNDAYFSENLLPKLNCPASDCTWPEVKSVGYCQVCYDIVPTIIESFSLAQVFETLAPTLKLLPTMTPTSSGWSSDVLNLSTTITLGDLGDFSLDLGTATAIREWGEGGSPSISLTLQSLVKYKAWSVADASQVGYNNEPNSPAYNTIPALTRFHDPLSVMAFTSMKWSSEGPNLDKTTVCSLSHWIRDYNLSVVSNEQKINSTQRTFGQFFIDLDTNPPWDMTYYNRPALCWRPDNVELDDINYSFFNPKDSAVCPYDKENFVSCQCEFDQFWSVPGNGDATFTDWLTSNITSTIGIPCANLTTPDIPTNNSYWNVSCDVADDYWARHEEVDAGVKVDDFGILWADGGPEQFMANLADGLTNEVLQHSSANVTGSLIAMITVVQVRWYWLILPAVLNLTAAFFLGLTMYITKQHRTPLWKTSLTAAFFHGLEHIPSTRADNVVISSIDEAAKGVRVRISRLQNSGRLIFSEESD